MYHNPELERGGEEEGNCGGGGDGGGGRIPVVAARSPGSGRGPGKLVTFLEQERIL
jgi:hypothetical protein